MVVEAGPGVESDADLVKKARSDPDAYRTGNFHDAEDLSSIVCLETFHFIYRPHPENSSRKEFIMESDTSFKPWLFRIAHNTKVNFLEQRSAHPLESLDDESDSDLFTSSMDPPEEAERAETSREIRAAINKLYEVDRQVIKLRDFDGLSFAEVGQAMGNTENNVRIQHHRALKRLRGILRIA